VVKHSRQRLKRGVRRRYLCKTCRKTFCSTTGTAYHKIQRSRRMFDWVVSLRMEGGSIAGISRLTGLSWNTVARWLRRAVEHAAHFNDRRPRRFELLEVQADELRTFVQGKRRVTWIYTAMEVSSRLWPVKRVGGAAIARRCSSFATSRRGRCRAPIRLSRPMETAARVGSFVIRGGEKITGVHATAIAARAGAIYRLAQ
jgi:hypothetical protein